jgi:hypothetical protein
MFTFMGEGYMDEGMPPTEDGGEEEEEVYLVGEVDPLELDYVSLATHVSIAKCVAEELSGVQPANLSRAAVYLVRREIRTATIAKRGVAMAYVERYGEDRYNLMSRTSAILWGVMKEEMATIGIERTTLYNNALVAAMNSISGGLKIRDLQKNEVYTIAFLMAPG